MGPLIVLPRVRIGIDYQILALGPDLITRGMGRYTQQQLRAVLSRDARSEYVLLCDAVADLSLIDPEVLAAPNVELACYQRPRTPVTEETTLELSEHYLGWVSCQGLDLYHATAPMMLEGPPLVQFDACPMVVTLYDLIPLRYPAHYLDPQGIRSRYQRALGCLQGATRLLAISEHARRDVLELLGYPAERIDRAWPAADDVFRPLPARLRENLLSVLRSRFPLPSRYLLTVSHIHHSKNLGTLLEGYAALPESFRSRLPLVLCCHLDPAALAAVRGFAAELGIGADLVTTGRVSDLELSALYCGATMLVHPSRSEGFGYPVLEAMRCGTPVITTTASSLPEVAGEAAILVDADDAAAFGDAIVRLAGDAPLRDDLRGRGYQQSANFNDQQLAECTLDCYRQAAGGEPAPAGRRRIAVWTPLPPLPTGIADYSAELLAGLAPRCDVEVFVDGGYLPDPRLLGTLRVHHASGFARRHAARPFDAVVYQVGASPFHNYMGPAFAAHPGIVALHDQVWSNVVYTDLAHERGDRAAFDRVLASLHGAHAVAELAGLPFANSDAVWDFFGRYPMLDPVVTPSLAQIVHLPDAARELVAAFPGVRPDVVAMGVADPYAGHPGLDRAGARRALGLPEDRFVFSVLGGVHPLKRVEQSLRAVAELRAAGRDPLLVVAGPCPDAALRGRLEDLAAHLRLGDSLLMTGQLSRDDFDRHLIATDAVVNLRAPVHKHMSAILMRAVAAGRPVVLSDLAEWRFLPTSFCFRVPITGEAAAVAAALACLEDDPGRRARMGSAARAWYEAEGTIARMAERYLAVVDRVAGEGAGRRAG